MPNRAEKQLLDRFLEEHGDATLRNPDTDQDVQYSTAIKDPEHPVHDAAVRAYKQWAAKQKGNSSSASGLTNHEDRVANLANKITVQLDSQHSKIGQKIEQELSSGKATFKSISDLVEKYHSKDITDLARNKHKIIDEAKQGAKKGGILRAIGSAIALPFKALTLPFRAPKAYAENLGKMKAFRATASFAAGQTIAGGLALAGGAGSMLGLGGAAGAGVAAAGTAAAGGIGTAIGAGASALGLSSGAAAAATATVLAAAPIAAGVMAGGALISMVMYMVQRRKRKKVVEAVTQQLLQRMRSQSMHRTAGDDWDDKEPEPEDDEIVALPAPKHEIKDNEPEEKEPEGFTTKHAAGLLTNMTAHISPYEMEMLHKHTDKNGDINSDALIDEMGTHLDTTLDVIPEIVGKLKEHAQKDKEVRQAMIRLAYYDPDLRPYLLAALQK